MQIVLLCVIVTGMLSIALCCSALRCSVSHRIVICCVATHGTAMHRTTMQCIWCKQSHFIPCIL